MGSSSRDKKPAEANRLVIPHIEGTNEDIRDAEHGNWPRIDDERLSDIAAQWCGSGTSTSKLIGSNSR
jgi:hypothetical protein